MGDIFGFVGTMLEPIRDVLYAYIGRQLGYLVHCKRNIKDFAGEVDSLILEKGRIQVEVETALNNAEVIHDDVKEWLSKVQSVEDDKTRLLQDKQNLKCVDVRSRYRLGKEGKKKKTRVTKLIEDGKNVRPVGHRPPLTRAWHRTYSINYESFESRKLVFEEIIKALKDDRNYKIGIYGMPGVGKTRMMQEVAQQAREDKLFDEIAKTVVSENPNLEKIQKQLAEALNLTLNKDTEGARKELLHNRLKGDKRILLMVDDLWNDQIKLEDIGIPATGEHTKGCKILLTSRRQDVCEAMGVPEKENFQIGVLSKAEASSLFKKKVGDSIEPHEMQSIAEAVCKECAGLPLAILAVGGALKNKSKQVWEDALKQLRNFMGENIAGLPTKLYSPIELSYNHLEPVDAKSLFLLCCLFPEDYEISIDYLVWYGFGMRLLQGVDAINDARNRSLALVDTLKTYSLLLEGSDEKTVKMHDVIRDVAISIASKEEEAMFLVKAGVKKWPEENEYKRCRTISLRLNEDCVLPNDSEFPELRTLMLGCEYSLEVPCSFFKGMEKLEVLYLEDLSILSLPSSLKNLRMLRLYDCQLVNVASLKELKKLEILSIEDYNLEELAPEIQQLTHLRLLDLRGCYRLKIIPLGVISSLSQLEELYIPDKFDEWEVEDNASLKELNSLKHLISLEVHVPNVELLPLNELLFKSLIRFKISIGSQFEDDEIRPSGTKVLKLVGFLLKRELNILMEKAEVLYLFELEGLKDVFHKGEGEGEGFFDLKYLKVVECDGVEHLFGKPKLISQTTRPCVSGSFSQLSVLEVERCELSYLFSSATVRGLLQLQKLTITDCEMLKEIVGDIEQEVMDTITFHQLKRMELKCLPNLRSFYGNTKKMSIRGCNTSTLVQALFNDKVAFPALEELEIELLESLTAIWDDQLQSPLVKEAEDSFRRLMYMKVFQCDKLVNVIPSNMLPKLRKLEKLEVDMCASVLYEVEVIDSVEKGYPIDILPHLQEMELDDLPNLVMYIRLKRLCVYSNLTDLHLSNRDSLENVFSPSTAKYLVHLQKLTVKNCEMMEEIVAVEREQLGEEDAVHDDDIIVFPQLKHLQLLRLPNLKSFCCCIDRSKIQEEETVEQNISTVEALFNHKVAFPALEKLEIELLGSLRAIWDDQLQSPLVKEAEDSFRRLMYMKVFQCDKLVNVIPSDMLTRLLNLEKVEVSKCDSVLYGVEVINSVEKGYPTAAPTINVLPCRQEMELYDLPNLVMYIRLKRRCVYSNLTDLHLSNRDNLENVFSPSTARYLVHLQKLTVKNCKMMEEIVAVEREQLGEEDAVHDDDIIVFPQLKHLQLLRLPNLKSFCCCIDRSKIQEEETVEQNISTVEALFNHKVAFPALEKLMIDSLGSLTAIWDDQLQSPLVKETDDSFRRLMYVKVFQCEKLVNVIPSDMLTRLLNLEKVEVSKCDSVLYGVEVINSVEKGYPTAAPTINVLPCRQEMELYDLPNLVMYIRLKRRCAYSNLTDLHLSNRDNLKNVFSPSTARYLVHLQKLIVKNCKMMEEIVAVERKQLGEEDVVHDDDIIVFPQLKHLKLLKLPNLKSFCCCIDGSKIQEDEIVEKNMPRVEALFNQKVAFPALEKLKIELLGSLTTIWDDQLKSPLVKEAEDSFRRLMYMKVFQCEKLMNVIPSYMLPKLMNLEKLEVSKCDLVPNLVMYTRLNRLGACSNLTDLHLFNRDSLGNVFSPSTARYLVHLQKLTVENCEMMEEIVAVEREQLGEEDVVHDDDIIVFPQLKHLQLCTLSNLKSFCCCTRESKKQEDEIVEQKNMPKVEALFNHKVRFPALEELEIIKLKRLTAIWDNQLFLGSGVQDSFRQLRLVDVEGCEKLVNVIPPNAIPMLQILESLEIVSCDSLISGVEVAAIGSDEILMFSQLKKLILKELPKLNSFCWSRRGGEERVAEESNIGQPQALFNHKVEFPMLEELVFDGIFEDIWLGHLGTGSFSKVRVIEMKKYSNIVNDCWQLLQWFEVVEEVKLESCYSLEVIFNLEGVDDAIQRKAIMVMSSQLQILTLTDLPKLNHSWITDSGGLLMFHNLTRLRVEKCNSMKYLFSLSIARRLTQLTDLLILDCDAMEEIVVKNEEHGEEDSTDEIVFSKLKFVYLANLAKLTSFCGASNAAFKLLSLMSVRMWTCPELQTFASGGIIMPHGNLEVNCYYPVSDLNKYVQQQYVGKGKGLQTVDNDDEGTSSSASINGSWDSTHTELEAI